MEYRIEKDSMGEVKVPANRYWGAPTHLTSSVTTPTFTHAVRPALL